MNEKTSQGVRDLNNLGPKRPRKVPAVEVPAGAYEAEHCSHSFYPLSTGEHEKCSQCGLSRALR